MITLTLKRGALLISSALILSACGGGGGSDMPGPDAGESKRQSLLYAYPDNGQTEVPTPAPVVLRFSSAVTVDAAEAAITLHEGDASGPALAATFSTVDGEPRGLVLTPDDKLKPLTDYTVVIKNLKLEKGTAANQVLGFTTRPLHEGPRSLVVSSDDFVIERRIPDGGSSEPVMDFSTFRFQFSQPIDPATVHYGNAPASSTAPADNVGLYDSQGNLVDAVLVVNDRYMTVDPNPQSDDPEDKYFSYLTPGETYTLRLGDGITSVYGETFGGDEIAFTPKDSSPRGEPAVLVQRITDSANRTNLSPLTGKPINEVPVNGVLLGEDANITQASNNAVMAELADVTQYPDVTPIRLPRNTVLDGSSIDVLIGGHVPAGFSSGQVEMRMLSDATGYLVPNPYNSNRSDALRIVHLFMDVAIATEDPRTNGAFTQDILHIELIGTAAVDTTEGVLNIDAVSVVEPNVLGQEYGYGLLSFQLQSYKDQTADRSADAREALVDQTAPALQSWVPGTNPNMYETTDPVIISFTEPLAPATVNSDTFQLFENGVHRPATVTSDGTSVIITPDSPFKKSTQISLDQSSDVTYEIVLSNQITDTSGNPLLPTPSLTFSFPAEIDRQVSHPFVELAGGMEHDWNSGIEEPVPQRSPIVLYMMPGFPCVLDSTTAALDDDIAGRCAGGLNDVYTSGSGEITRLPDDLLPVQELPANSSIIVHFSREIDPNSVTLGGSFLVEKQAADNSWQSIQGNISLSGKRLTFFPEKPWEEGILYRYTLRSNGDNLSAANQTNCDGSQSICDINGLPIQTQLFDTSLLIQPPDMVSRMAESTAGGPDMTQYFRGAQTSEDVTIVMAGSSADSNANFYHESNMSRRPSASDFPAQIAGYREFGDIHERDASESPADPHAHEKDPEGVAPPDNSAKIVSLATGTADPNLTGPFLNGITIGCGWEPVEDYSDPNEPRIPLVCPQDRFTYLTSAIAANITTEYSEDGGLKVNLWPGQIMSTSISIYTILSGYVGVGLNTGPQLMRMRYSKEDPSCQDSATVQCMRTKPISALIKEGENGKPILEAEVDVYIDLPDLYAKLFEIGLAGQSHNLSSLPATLKMEGEINFLDDGRMTVNQVNINDVDINFEIEYLGYVSGNFKLIVPAYGTNLVYNGDPVKGRKL
ncbi:Ig-like domain-containing domain [Alloalcanivorax xenomutans]|uniref:Ig-like domain-containing protein n=1 Tax=Alloalcanivorax xenomutans TaxID=1094342 RepID=UPI00047E40A9